MTERSLSADSKEVEEIHKVLSADKRIKKNYELIAEHFREILFIHAVNTMMFSVLAVVVAGVMTDEVTICVIGDNIPVKQNRKKHAWYFLSPSLRNYF